MFEVLHADADCPSSVMQFIAPRSMTLKLCLGIAARNAVNN